MESAQIWTQPGFDRSGDAEDTPDVGTLEANDAYPPPQFFSRQYKASGLLQLFAEMYSKTQKRGRFEGMKAKRGRYGLLRLMLDWDGNRFDDFLSEVANAIGRLFFSLNSPVCINPISIDAYAEQFRWIDWSRRVTDGPPQQFHLEVTTNDSSRKSH
jgi:hypothetical protein